MRNRQRCVLCGEFLNKYPTNREHYVPQVLIREFNKLGVPHQFDWALRQNQVSLNHGVLTETISVPRKNHKTWAVVEVHEKCNLEASGMCRDLRYVIDHLDGPIDKKYFRRPIEYYAHLWRTDPSTVSMAVISRDDVKGIIEGADRMRLYKPGCLFAGRIVIVAEQFQPYNDYEWHTISLGTKEALALN